MPSYPRDLDKWVIPRTEATLPAEIYTDNVLIIDDGYDRSKLDMPGVLHIECGAKWSQVRDLDPPTFCHSSGLSSGRSGALSIGAPASPAQKAAAPEADPEAAPMPVLPPPTEDGGDLPSSQPKDAFLEIIGNTKKCISAQRWVSADPSQPSTVEFWLPIFHGAHR